MEYSNGANSRFDLPKSDLPGSFNKLRLSAENALHDNSLSSIESLSDKNGYQYRLSSKQSYRNSKEQNKSDLGLISATTSPYRSEWENKNRPFCTRFYPPLDTDTNRRLLKYNDVSSTYPSHTNTKHLINIREAEKDRLAEIFALSPLYRRYNQEIISDVGNKPNQVENHLLNNVKPNGTETCIERNLNIISSCSESLEHQNYKTDKAIQTDESIYPERDHSSKFSCNNKDYPEKYCFANKQVQTSLEAESIILDAAERNKFLQPEHSILSSNDEQISPRKFASSVFKENNGLQFSPLVVNTSPNSDKRMVRIGEFSPLNPKLSSPGQALLGLGEYEERRKLLMEQRKHEYLEQVRLKAKNNEDTKKILQHSNMNFEVKHVTTQTDHADPSKNLHQEQDHIQQDLAKSPFSNDIKYSNDDILGKNTVQLKQFLYREELRKQIEERQRIESEKKKKEKIEEEVIECKIKQQQEEMQRRFEAEVAERMQIAKKKKEQEEALHKRLLEMQKQTVLDKKQNWQNRKEIVTCSPRSECQQVDNVAPIALCTSPVKFSENSPRHCYQKEREKILKEITDEKQNLMHTKLPSPLDQLIFTANHCSDKVNRKQSSPLNKKRAFTVLSSVTGDPISKIAQQRAEAENILRRPLIDSTPPFPLKTALSPSKSTSPSVIVDKSLGSPLLHDHNVEVRSDLGKSALPAPRSTSPPIPAIQNRVRSNCETLEDKWQVPVVEKFVMTPMDIHSQNNNRVLTQLGAFRKHLQQEQMRLAQELKSTKLKPS